MEIFVNKKVDLIYYKLIVITIKITFDKKRFT